MSVASKNLYDLLGNDIEDENAGPPAPVKTVEKTSTHTTKRNADGVAATKAPATTAPRRTGPGGNEGAFRDRQAGSDRNRGKPTDEAPRSSPRGGFGARARGGRGGRFPRNSDERQSRSGTVDTEKAIAAGWGATEGDAELKDEQAGEAIAQADKKEAEQVAEEVPEEEEDKHITYDQYLAQVAEKKAALESEGALALRKANEGIKDNKKWANAKPLPKEEGEDYFAASGGKAKRERERKVKQVVELENRYIEPERTGGGRGGARGDGARGRGRGAPRGGEFRGGPRGGGRGAPRGGDFHGGAPRGGGRGSAPRGGDNKPINANDESAFPSLGGK